MKADATATLPILMPRNPREIQPRSKAGLPAPEGRAVVRSSARATKPISRAPRPSESQPAFDLQVTPGHLLRRAHQRSHELFNDGVGDYGLTRQQTALMIAIRQDPGANQQVLSDSSGFDRNTLADISRRLLRRGLIERRRSGRDGRAWEITLTREGLELLEAMLPELERVQRRILEPLPPKLRATFIRCLQILIGVNGSARPRPLR